MKSLYFEDLGDSNKPLIVLLPGLLASTNYWRKIALVLAKDFRVITIDQLGFGKSPKPDGEVDYTIEENIRFYKDLFAQENINKIELLVGYSSSAILASEFILQVPNLINKVLLISPPFFQSKEDGVKYLKKSFPTYRIFMKTFLKFFFIPFVTVFKPILRYFAKYLITHIDEPSAKDAFSFTWKSLYNSIENIIVKQSILPKLGQIKIPVKILYSKKDELKNDLLLESLPLRYKNFQIQEIDATHQIPYQKPEEVIKVVQDLFH